MREIKCRPGVRSAIPTWDGSRLSPCDWIHIPLAEYEKEIEPNWPYITKADFANGKQFLQDNPEWADEKYRDGWADGRRWALESEAEKRMSSYHAGWAKGFAQGFLKLFRRN